MFGSSGVAQSTFMDIYGIEVMWVELLNISLSKLICDSFFEVYALQHKVWDAISLNSKQACRPNDFPFKNWPISVSHFSKFRLTANFYRFCCLLVIFHTKMIMP